MESGGKGWSVLLYRTQNTVSVRPTGWIRFPAELCRPLYGAIGHSLTAETDCRSCRPSASSFISWTFIFVVFILRNFLIHLWFVVRERNRLSTVSLSVYRYKPQVTVLVHSDSHSIPHPHPHPTRNSPLILQRSLRVCGQPVWMLKIPSAYPIWIHSQNVCVSFVMAFV